METPNDLLQYFLSKQDMIDGLSISLLLGILGIAITIFTVIYSFMESAKQRKRVLGDKIALLENIDPVMQSDYGFIVNYLRRLKHMNISILVIILADIVAISCYGVHLLMPQSTILWFVSLSMEAVLIIGSLTCLFIYMLQYYKRFNNI